MRVKSFELRVKSEYTSLAVFGLTIASILFFFLFSCSGKQKTYAGYSKRDNFYYKLLAIGDGKTRPDTNLSLWIDVVCKTQKDSVFWDSRHKAPLLLFSAYRTYSFSPFLYSYNAGDSMELLMPCKMFFKEFFNLPVAVFSEKDSCVKLSVKILRAISEPEKGLITDSINGSLAAGQGITLIENKKIKEYAEKNFKLPQVLHSGIVMEKLNNTTLDSIKRGKKISMLYKGYYLDGQLVDQSPNARPFEFVFGQEGQIIDGLRQALYHLKKGEKAKIIVPSHLAFGSSGSSNGSIAPYTPLLYEIEIIDVK